MPFGAESRTGWAGPAELSYLLHRVQAARAEIEALRSQARSLASNPEQLRLLDSLENYVAALQSRHLPVPPAIRDELQLQRCLVSRKTANRPASRRRSDRK
jgi:plasmid stabilization system protein ParE